MAARAPVPRAARAVVNSTQASGRPSGDRRRGVLQPVRDPDPGSPCSRQREGTLSGSLGAGEEEGQAGAGGRRGHRRFPSGRGQRPPRVRGGDRRRGTPAWPPSSESRAAHPGRLIRLHLLRGDRSRGSGFSAQGGLRPPLHAPCAARSPLRTGPRRPESPVRAGGEASARARAQRRLCCLPASRASAPRRDPWPSGPAPRHSRRRVRSQHLNF